MNKRIHTLKYLFADYLAAALVWSIFYFFRKIYFESQKYGYNVPIELDNRFYLGLLIIPLFWIILYYTNGYYKNIYRKSRLKEIGNTFTVSLIGVLIIFFALLLDDTITSYKDYYISLIVLFSLHFIFTYIPRFIITNKTIAKLRKRLIGFNTIVVGSNEKAVELFEKFLVQPKSSGNKFIGFINVQEKAKYLLEKHLPHIGSYEQLNEIIAEKQIEEVIIAIETSEQGQLMEIIDRLRGTNVIIKVIPSMYDILTGAVNMSTIYGVPLIEIKHDLMPAWEESIKRVLDVIFSVIAILLLTPIYIFLAVGVRMSSKGPIFYSHERIGRYGRPFQIYKFRSMYIGSERNGPALSSKNDPRITPFGLFMRKSRLDEVPQFYNVLIGDMSLVGPRPERQFYIDKIVQKAPHYYHLQKVRPGITSWGQVKYGYAENVDEMIERLAFDLIYIENMSLYVDFKIMIYTIKIVFSGLGK